MPGSGNYISAELVIPTGFSGHGARSGRDGDSPLIPETAELSRERPGSRRFSRDRIKERSCMQ